MPSEQKETAQTLSEARDEFGQLLWRKRKGTFRSLKELRSAPSIYCADHGVIPNSGAIRRPDLQSAEDRAGPKTKMKRCG